MIATLSFVLLAAIQPTDAACSEARVRYSFDEYKSLGKTELYFEAIATAVENGKHKAFADAHAFQMAHTAHAHRKGTFLIWHRVFLTAYENMLRSLDTKFECVTIPYWNYYRETSLLAGSSGGKTVYDVSQIFSEMPIGLASRSDWASYKSFPSAVSLASSIAGLDVNDYEKSSKHIENTVHNAIHNWLGATMSTGQSPLDPIFYSHHGMIDVLHAIYYKCKSGPGKDDNYKQNDPIAYVPWGGAPKSTDSFVVEAGGDIQEYFDELPKEYFNYLDSEAIPSNDYSYHLDSNLIDEMSKLSCVVATNPVDSVDGNTTTDSSVVPAPTPAPPAPTPEEQNMIDFVDSITDNCFAIDGNTQEKCKEEAKNIECLCFDEVFGVEDFTDEFRKNFMIPEDEHTECAQAVIDHDAAKAAGNVTDFISVPEETWKASCLSHFGKAKLDEEEKRTKNPQKVVKIAQDVSDATSLSASIIFTLVFLILS